jgi:hypothetical protein
MSKANHSARNRWIYQTGFQSLPPEMDAIIAQLAKADGYIYRQTNADDVGWEWWLEPAGIERPIAL